MMCIIKLVIHCKCYITLDNCILETFYITIWRQNPYHLVRWCLPVTYQKMIDFEIHSHIFKYSEVFEALTYPRPYILVIKGAYSLHTPFLELARKIKYSVSISIGEWHIIAMWLPVGCLGHIFTWNVHGLSQICSLQQNILPFLLLFFLFHYLAAYFQVFTDLWDIYIL